MAKLVLNENEAKALGIKGREINIPMRADAKGEGITKDRGIASSDKSEPIRVGMWMKTYDASKTPSTDRTL